MSGWKARIGYLSPSVFETPSDWDLILPKGFTIVSSGLNVQSHTEAEFNKAIDALAAGLGIFAAKSAMPFSWVASLWEPNAATLPSKRSLPSYRGKLVCR